MSKEHPHDHGDPQVNHEKALSILKKAGFKNTRTRQSLIKALLKEHGPFSIEELQLRMEITCDLATIYRNIAIFVDLGLVSPCDFGDGLTRYEWTGAEHEHHHHIICKRCHQIEQLEYCFVKELEKLINNRGYSQVSHRLEFYGICENCRNSEQHEDAPS